MSQAGQAQPQPQPQQLAAVQQVQQQQVQGVFASPPRGQGGENHPNVGNREQSPGNDVGHGLLYHVYHGKLFVPKTLFP